jgi:hypothetical protein
VSVTGVIGVPCRLQGRWSPFWSCLNRLERPANVWIEPNYDNSVAKSRNLITQTALELGAEWIFWLDDDLLFPADVLINILKRPESIVIGLTMMRMQLTGQFRPIWSNMPIQMVNGEPIWTPVETIETGSNGLMRLTSGTGGGVLMQTEIFHHLPQPWWRIGQLVPDMFWEDIWFYEQAARAGIPIWGDPSVRFGHMSDLTIWPHQDASGQWSTVLANGFDGFLQQPWTTPVLA